jgi:hypothetical protein
MKADGSEPRVVWDSENAEMCVQGIAWAPAVAPAEAEPEAPTEVVEAPAPLIETPAAEPEAPPAPLVPRQPRGPAVKLHSAKLFTIETERSPVSVRLATPETDDFVVSVPALPAESWRERRQGIGITLEMEDGSLYRGNVIHNEGPWVTIQGRPEGGQVRMLDHRRLSVRSSGFEHGFKLSVRREGNLFILAVDDEDVLSRPVLEGSVKSISLTLENFDAGAARFNVGNIYYQLWQPASGGAFDLPGAPEHNQP